MASEVAVVPGAEVPAVELLEQGRISCLRGAERRDQPKVWEKGRARS